MKTVLNLVAETANRAKHQGKPIRRAASQIPLWADKYRGLPNDLARSALFCCAGHKAPRRQFKREKIASVNGFDLIYNGTELRQDDEDVFLQIVHLARLQPLENGVEVTGSQLLKLLLWPRNEASYDRLKEIIQRLKEGTINIKSRTGTRGFSNSLLRKYTWKDEGAESKLLEKWRLWVEPEVVLLFSDQDYSLIDWEGRLKLGILAKWLHSFYSTHRDPVPYKTQTLKDLCGSLNTNLASFRQTLKLAFDELVSAGFLSSFEHQPETDTFRVIRAVLRRLPEQTEK
jgi:hypothetical protein